MAKPNFILPNKPAIKAGSILSYNYTDDLTFAAEPLDFSRNSSATRVNEQGLIEEVGYFGPQLVQNGDFSQEGPELITNGDFATDLSGWTTSNTDATNTITWETDGARIISTTNLIGIQQNNVLTIGKSYKLTCDVAITTGSLGLDGVTAGATIAMVEGFNEIYFTAVSTTFKIKRTTGNSNCLLDNVSIKEVGQDWVLGTDWGIGNNKAIRTGTTSSVLAQSGTFSLGKKFKLNFTITDWTTGNLEGYFYGGGGSDTFFNISNIGNGTFTFETTTTTNRTNIAFYASGGFDGSITNVSVIEIIGDKPRIDYSDSSTEPSLLLEPQSTNLIPYSNDFSQWGSLSNASVINNASVSPDGTLNADEFVFDGTNNGRVEKLISTTSGLVYTFSIYLKNKDIANPTQVFIGNNTFEGEFVTITNEWQRFTFIQTANGTSRYPRVRYNGVGSLYAYGAQFEQLSYATSYIPTYGSTATRLGETANNAGGAGVFNSEEGVLYAEIAALADDLTFREIALSDGTSNNTVELRFRNASNDIQAIVRAIDGAYSVAFGSNAYTITNFNKIAFSYKANDFNLWINGVKVATDNSGVTPIGLSELAFDNGTSNNFFYGKTKNLQVFNHALTDEELQTLTT